MHSCCDALHQGERACRRCSQASCCPIYKRNQAVVSNLGLAHFVAERYIRRGGWLGGAAPEDIHAAACAGLVRCMELFEARQGHALSTYAVPYLTGTIQHELRDRWQPIKVPRRMQELQQRAAREQKRRHKRGLPPLSQQQLAAHLGTSEEQLEQAELGWLALQRVYSLEELAALPSEQDWQED